jgi:hypothetical protein
MKSACFLSLPTLNGWNLEGVFCNVKGILLRFLSRKGKFEISSPRGMFLEAHFMNVER